MDTVGLAVSCEGVCWTGFHPGFFNWVGPASFTSQILYLIIMLGKNLTRHFPGIAIKQRVWSARLGFSRSSMQCGTIRRDYT